VAHVVPMAEDPMRFRSTLLTWLYRVIETGVGYVTLKGKEDVS